MSEENEVQEKVCILCQNWQSLGHYARHTTPVNVDEVHHAFVVGAWTAAAARIGATDMFVCDEHRAHLAKISEDAIRNAREVERRKLAEPTPKQAAAIGSYRQRMAHLQRFPCPDCGISVGSGEVHSCPVPVPAPPTEGITTQ